MEKCPKISVITPVYNVKDYLKECIESVIKQSYKNIEFLIVDDGSDDGSGDICDEYAKKDARITVIHKMNEGQAIARNVALDCMTGDYVLFVDSDDYLEVDVLKKMIDSITETTDLLCCNINVDNGVCIQKVKSISHTETVGKDRLFKLYLEENRIFTGPWAKLIKASIFRNIRFPELRCNEDVYILHDIFDKCSEISLNNECLYTLRIRENSTEHKPFSHHKMNLMIACDRIEKYTYAHYPEYMNAVLKNRLNCSYSLMISIVKSNNLNGHIDDYEHLLEDFRKTFDRLGNVQEKKFIRLYTDESLFMKDIKCTIQKEKMKQLLKKGIRFFKGRNSF